MYWYEKCPGCGATGQTTGIYCNECGAPIAYEDPEADRRRLSYLRMKAWLKYLFNALLGTGLLLCLAISLLYFWGNMAKGSTTVITGLGAALETEESIIPVADGSIVIPRPHVTGPLLLSFRYLLSPPDCNLVLKIRSSRGTTVFEDSKKARFLLGECRFRIPAARFSPGSSPYELAISQNDKPIISINITFPETR